MLSLEADQVGYDCGYTYLTGGRPQLTPEQQRELANSLAEGCCSSFKAHQAFVTSFQNGYSRRTQEKAQQQENTNLDASENS